MRYLCLLTSALLLLIVGSCKTVKKPVNGSISTTEESKPIVTPDSIVVNLLNDTIVDYLFAPDSVTAAKLGEKTTVTNLSKSKSFEKISGSKLIEGKDLQLLQLAHLADQHNYQNDSIIVMSPFIPAMEIDFFKGGDFVKMIVSFSDRTWMLLKDDKRILKFNYASELPLRKIYNKL